MQDPEPSNDNAVETGEDNELDQDEFENSINKMGTPGASKTQSQEFRSCKYCSKKINIYGIYMHEKSCQKKSMVKKLISRKKVCIIISFVFTIFFT